jgi:four helix bundle protein
METYRDFVVRQKSKDVAVLVYKITKEFPAKEKNGLTSQMRRAATSISSNIAEGRLRNSSKEFKRFSLIAFSSGGELETQIKISKEVLNLTENTFLEAEKLLTEIMKMFNTMISNRSASVSNSLAT